MMTANVFYTVNCKDLLAFCPIAFRCNRTAVGVAAEFRISKSIAPPILVNFFNVKIIL